MVVGRLGANGARRRAAPGRPRRANQTTTPTPLYNAVADKTPVGPHRRTNDRPSSTVVRFAPRTALRGGPSGRVSATIKNERPSTWVLEDGSALRKLRALHRPASPCVCVCVCVCVRWLRYVRARSVCVYVCALHRQLLFCPGEGEGGRESTAGMTESPAEFGGSTLFPGSNRHT